jgi:hypothetical protein
MELNHLVERINRGTIKDLVIDYRRHMRHGHEQIETFLGVLQSSTTIETVECPAYYDLGITIPNWVALVRAIGCIRTLSRLSLVVTARSEPGTGVVHGSRRGCTRATKLRTDPVQ